MKLSENALKVAEFRYFKEGETWETCCRRVAKAAASVESNGQKAYWEEQFFGLMFDLKFLPGGRVLRNAGTNLNKCHNCHSLPLEDSIVGIGEFLKKALVLNSEGGGVGFLANLRPKGAPIKGKGGVSSGLCSFLRVISYALDVVETAGARRSGGLSIVPITHPEVIDYINIKLDESVMNNFNISVGITNEFLEAVEKNDVWELKYGKEVYKTLPAKELFDLIISNMLKSGEPGLVNLDKMKINNSWYFAPISSLNLCVTGDTKVAVADGRGEVPIKQLAKENKDIPVFCLNNDGDVVVKTMRHPRITGYKKKLLKVTFDDGSFLRCTEDHEIRMKDGDFKKAASLITNDRVSHVTKYKLANIRASKSNTPYWFWNRGPHFQKAEHRIIYEGLVGIIPDNCVVHHKNFNSLDNTPDNLAVMLKEEHSNLHSSISTKGSNNGRYLGVSPEELIKIAIQLSKEYGRRLTKNEWHAECKNRKLPFNSKYQREGHKGVSSWLKECAVAANVEDLSKSLIAIRRLNSMQEQTDLPVVHIKGKGLCVVKHCESCGREFVIPMNLREQGYCSRKCGRASLKIKESQDTVWCNKQSAVKVIQANALKNLCMTLGRTPLKKEWENYCRNNNIPFRLHYGGKTTHSFQSYKEVVEAADAVNFKVVSVVEDGFEDVYSCTVDEFHNYFCVVYDGENKKKLINSMNCGELPLQANSSCCLGSIILPSFCSGGKTRWDEMATTIHTAVRFLDNILDVNNYTFQDMKDSTLVGRRVGLGVIGLADYLFTKKVRYGSEIGVDKTDDVIKFLRDEAYKGSIELSKEKGPFPGYNDWSYNKAKFILSLPGRIRSEIKKHAIRNVTLLALAPTGSLSLLCDCSSGIEPLFSKAYKRVDAVGERTYIHPLLKKCIDMGEGIPDWFVDSGDITPVEHFETSAAISKLNDSAAAKTINLPKGTTHEQLACHVLEYARELIGITVYVDGSREGQPLQKLTNDEIMSYINKEHINNQSEDDVKCKSGVCGL